MFVIMVHSHDIFGDEIPSAVTLKFLTIPISSDCRQNWMCTSYFIHNVLGPQ